MKNTQENFTEYSEEEIQELTNKVNWEKEGMNGMIPVITQDVNSKEILMQAFANREAFENTLRTGNATYWSRSRNENWEKGLTSGATQVVYDINIDCDRDSITYIVEQLGEVGACHLDDQNSCFETDTINLRSGVENEVGYILDKLFWKLNSKRIGYNRGRISPETSYTAKLLEEGKDSILEKIGEEATELIIGAKNNDRDNVIYEISDLLYFLNVLMVDSLIYPYQIADELSKRMGTSGIEEKKNRKK